MVKHRFKGGLILQGHKELTGSQPIITLAPPKRLYYPMQQAFGVQLKPVLSVGDFVKKGQKLADGVSPLAVPLHSAVSGRVASVELYPHPNGGKVKTIVVENNGQNTAEMPLNRRPLSHMTRDEIIALIREAGIVGLGGAGFPTHAKLAASLKDEIHTVIVNGAECEPYVTANHRFMIESPMRVIDGISVLQRLFTKAQIVVAAEEGQPSAVAAVKTAADTSRVPVSVFTLPNRYPQGSEKHLIYSVTGRRVPLGGLPKDVGCLVLNVHTVAAVADAVLYGHPLTETIVTVSGSCVARPANYAVRVGTPLSELVAAAGRTEREPKRVIVGGPMMGQAIRSTQVPVLKTTASVLVLAEEGNRGSESACIRCGRCAAVCPMRLRPLMLDGYIRRGEWQACMREHIFDCIECGCCAYACPSKRLLVQSLQWGKQAAKRHRLAGEER